MFLPLPQFPAQCGGGLDLGQRRRQPFRLALRLLRGQRRRRALARFLLQAHGTGLFLALPAFKRLCTGPGAAKPLLQRFFCGALRLPAGIGGQGLLQAADLPGQGLALLCQPGQGRMALCLLLLLCLQRRHSRRLALGLLLHLGRLAGLFQPGRAGLHLPVQRRGVPAQLRLRRFVGGAQLLHPLQDLPAAVDRRLVLQQFRQARFLARRRF